jgi:hypothetical protein
LKGTGKILFRNTRGGCCIVGLAPSHTAAQVVNKNELRPIPSPLTYFEFSNSIHKNLHEKKHKILISMDTKLPVKMEGRISSTFQHLKKNHKDKREKIKRKAKKISPGVKTKYQALNKQNK